MNKLEEVKFINKKNIKLEYQSCQSNLASLRKLDCYRANEDSEIIFCPNNDRLVTVGDVVSSVLAKNCEVAREGGNSCHAICGALLYFVVHVKLVLEFIIL